MTIEEYKAKKTQIDTLEKEVNKAEGSLETLMDDLKKNFGVTTLDEAATLLEKYESDIKELDEDIKTKLDKLDSLTDWSKL